MAVTLGNFDPLASAYEASRPEYPHALLEKLLSRLNLRPGETIVDIGAGTGKFTRLLTTLGRPIIAIEPGDVMRAEGEKALASFAGQIAWRKGTAEDTGLPDKCAAWVTMAQAFHWVNPALGLPEIHRILRKEGHLTILWNSREMEATPILRSVRTIIDRNVPDFERSDHNKPWEKILTSTGHFQDVTTVEVSHIIPMSRERFATLWRSHNKLQIRLGPDRFARFLEELREFLDTLPDEMIEVPYMCKAWTVKKGLAIHAAGDISLPDSASGSAPGGL